MDEKAVSEIHGGYSNDEVTDSAEPTSSIFLDRVLSAVANEHRRAILNALIHAPDKTLEYDALVDRVVEQIHDEDADRVSDEHRQEVRIVLYHTHLPKLEESRIVDFEADTGHVQFVGGELEQQILTHAEQQNAH